MAVPFAPEQDIAAALVAKGAVYGPAGGLFALVANTNLFAGQPRSPFEAGVSGVNPGVWIDTSTVPSKKPAPFLNAPQAGSLWFAGVRLWAITNVEASNVDAKKLGYLLARQLRDTFHTKVYAGSATLGTYINAFCIDQGDVKFKKPNDARQYQFFTDFEIQWWNVN